MADETGFQTWNASDFEQSIKRLRSAGIDRTPIKKSLWLSKEIEGEVFIKLENVHEGNSFKLRGATNFLLAYKEKHGRLPSNVVTASGGNHGVAVAVACFKLSVPCTVVLPSNSVTPTKVHLLSDCYKAKIEVQGSCFQDANDFAVQLAKDTPDGCYIHPYAHPWIVQGAGTIFTEIQQQFDTLPEVIVASLGGGGMVAGMISSRNASGYQDQVKIASVETEGADYYYQSHLAGHLITLPKITSIAVTLGASTGTPETFKLFQENITLPMIVSDKEAVEALWSILDQERVLVEPACSAAIAGLLKYKENFKGKRVVVILCGGSPSLADCLKWKAEYMSDSSSSGASSVGPQ